MKSNYNRCEYSIYARIAAASVCLILAMMCTSCPPQTKVPTEGTLTVRSTYGTSVHPDAQLRPPDVVPSGGIDNVTTILRVKSDSDGELERTAVKTGIETVSQQFVLPAGSYTASAAVYTNEGGFAASASSQAILAAGGSADADLTPLPSDGAGGTLSLTADIAQPIAARSALVEGTGADGVSFSYTVPVTDGRAVFIQTVPAGFYDVKIGLYKYASGGGDCCAAVFLRAYIAAGRTSSADISFAAEHEGAVPALPGIALVSIDEEEMTALISWDGINFFNQYTDIERSADGGSTWLSVAGSLHFASSGFTDRLIVPGASYIWRIKYRNMFGSSSWQSTASVTVPGDSSAVGGYITTIRLTELDGIDNTPFPAVVSVMLAQGDAVDALAVKIGGQVLPSQTDIKVRWHDGSIKHALVSFLLPSLLKNSTAAVDIHNGAHTNSYAAAQTAQLVSQNFSAYFEVEGNGNSIDIADLITAEKVSSGEAKTWMAGSVVNEVQVSNFLSTDKRLSIWASVRYFKDYPGVRIFHAVENVRAEGTAADETYSLSVSGTLSAAGEEPFSGEVLHISGDVSEWDTRHGRISWIGKKPSSCAVAYDTDYLLSTGIVPSYDSSITVPASAVSSMYSQWQSADKETGGTGLITKYFPNTGWRYEIGLLPQFTAMHLLSMDKRLEEIVIGHGIISGYAPIHVRETRDGASGRGKYISIDDRPGVWIGDYRGDAGDEVKRDYYNYKWQIDRAHQGSLAYVPYLITGDLFYLEELIFWNAWNLASMWPAPSPDGRGGSSGIIKDQVRGDAWIFRELGRAVSMLPDSFSADRDYFAEKMENTLDFWIDRYITNTYHPLGVWEYVSHRGLDGGRPTDYFSWRVRHISTPWQEYFLLQSMGHVLDVLGGPDAGSLGSKTDQIRHYTAQSIVSLIENLGPERAFTYRLPVSVSTHEYPDGVTRITSTDDWRALDRWQDVEDCYIKDTSLADVWEMKDPLPSGWENPPALYPSVWPKEMDFPNAVGSPSCSAIDYPMVCFGALAYAYGVSGADHARSQLETLLSDEIPLYNANPTFALKK